MQTNVQHETNVTPVITHSKSAHSHEFKHHMWSYFASITLTIFAFIAVWYKIIESPMALGMFILLLAAVQVVFQMYIWMHMNHKGHTMPIIFILSGIFVAIITVAALMLLIGL